MGRIGLRYRPNNNTDLVAHNAQLALLANDLAGIPIKYLEKAETAWVKSHQGRFMPKAADLIELARAEFRVARDATTPKFTIDELIRQQNERLNRSDIEWFNDNGSARLRHKRKYPSAAPPISQAEVENVNRMMQRFGLESRFTYDDQFETDF